MHVYAYVGMIFPNPTQPGRLNMCAALKEHYESDNGGVLANGALIPMSESEHSIY